MKKKSLQELTIKDNYMFVAVMTEGDGKNCKDFLEQLLNIKISKIEFTYEKVINTFPGYHGIRMDVYGKDENNTRYNIEMQLRSTDVQRRSRYYHSMMDKDNLSSNKDYAELGETYVIFICDYDPLGFGKYRYTIDSVCKEVPEYCFDDGRHTILLSTKGQNDSEESAGIIKFLKFVQSNLDESERDFDDEYVKQLQESIRVIKGDHRREEEYMVLEEMLREERAEGKAEGKVEGIAEGKEEKTREIVLRLHNMKFSIENIMEAADLSKEKVEEIINAGCTK